MHVDEFTFITRKRYYDSLSASFNFVELPADFYTRIANKTPPSHYLDKEFFIIFLNENKDELPRLSKEIDRDVMEYWAVSLVKMAKIHDALVIEYNDRTKGIRKRKSLHELYGKPNEALLNTIASRISTAAKNLPKKEFTDHSHVKKWQRAAEICVPQFIKAIDTHKSIVAEIEKIDKNRAEKLNSIIKGVLGVASTVARLAKPLAVLIT